MNNRVYISGKITNTLDYMERFDKVQKLIESLGYEVVNPALVCSFLPITCTYEQYMQVSYTLIDICDYIYIMNETDTSKGVELEKEYASQNNKKFLKIGYHKCE